jgi:hypothetical protein
MKIIIVVLLLATVLNFGIGLSLKNDVAKSKDDLTSQIHKPSLLQVLDKKADEIIDDLKVWFYQLKLPCFKSSEDDYPGCLKEILPFVRFDYNGGNIHRAHSELEKFETTPVTTVSFCISLKILRVN